MINRVTLIGRLGHDASARETTSGPVTSFSLATSETYKDKAGEKQKRTEWHNVVVWGKLADVCKKFLRKGDLVFIEGRIQSREWDDKKTGQKKKSTEIICDAMQMLGDKPVQADVPAAADVPFVADDSDFPF